MRISVPYGRTRMEADVPDDRLLGVFDVFVPEELGNFADDACGGDDEPLVVFFQ